MLSMCSKTEQETEILGVALAKQLFPGAFVALWGGLGAGKTAFARGVGKGLGANTIKSPTFTVLHSHEQGRLPLHHFDAYRLNGEDELWDIGYDEYVNGSGVVLLEWPERVLGALPRNRLDVKITGNGDDPRKIDLLPYGDEYEKLLSKLDLSGEVLL
ncbi:tRNA (adenosine(37)-N6)-threonylcarbamoyltransferase complex ATPase subunit type 1 TsaE [Eubacteriales bacterium OttesenSCG-928-K08]|nr:tRNA (adenosine(37)-N6)-threonylcarbamoyltransferase complex ATPase subunit type 1 TsaE [Eubacteriales bacterium OttesenSCG-928-K08]